MPALDFLFMLSKRGYLLFGCSSAAMEPEAPVYERIVLKLSGEAMQQHGGRDNISPPVVREIAERMKEVRDLGVEVAVVIGGGNIWRGLSAADRGMDRTTADYMGMLATVINALALRSTLEQIGVEARVQTAIEMKNVAEPFILGRAVRHLELGRVVIFAAGTGNPYFSTDTTAALRASEIRADVILKATRSTACTIATRTSFRTRAVTTGSRSPKRSRSVSRSWIRPRSVSVWTTKSPSLCSTCTRRESCTTPCWGETLELWFAMNLHRSKHSAI